MTAARARGRVMSVVLSVAITAVVLLMTGSAARAQSGTSPSGTIPASEPTRVRLAVHEVDPFVVKNGDSYTGFSVDLWNEVARRNNFATQYVPAQSVDDQLDDVRQGRADVAIGAINVTSDRLKTVSFSLPTFNGGLQIVTPTSHASGVGAVLGSLTDSAVLRLFILFLVSALVAAMIVWLVERKTNPEFGHAASKGVFEGLWWAVVTMLTVGYGDRVTRTTAGRVFSVLWMFLGVLLVAQLTATFSANLNREQSQSVVRGPQDLLGNRVVTVQGSDGATYLDQQGIPNTKLRTESEMVNAVAAGQYDAGVYNSPVLIYQVNTQGNSRLRLAGGPFTLDFYAIAMPPTNNLAMPINQALTSAEKDGTYNRILAAWFGHS